MRYVIAMIAAIVAAGLASTFIATPIASWTVRQFTFDNPDSVASLHAAVFMAVNIGALVAGFVLGWGLGWRFKPKA